MLVVRALDEPPGLNRELAIAAARRAMASTRHELATAKLMYELNPTLACASPLLARHPVPGLAHLLAALESISESVDGSRILDLHLNAFVAVRRAAAGLKAVRSGDALADLRLISSLAVDFKSGPLPNLAKRLAGPMLPELESWPGVSRRKARQAALEATVATGDLAALLALGGDENALLQDKSAQAEAHARVESLRGVRAALDAELAGRQAVALRFGREGVAVFGAAACAVALLMQLLP